MDSPTPILNKILGAGLLPGILVGAADIIFLWRTSSANWGTMELLADGFFMCGAVLGLAFFFEFVFPDLLTPTRGASLMAGAIALAAAPLTIWLSMGPSRWIPQQPIWWHRTMIALSASYFVVAIAQLTRRNGHLFRSLLSLIFASVTGLTVVPAIRAGQEAVAFVCFVGTLASISNAYFLGYVGLKEMKDTRRDGSKS